MVHINQRLHEIEALRRAEAAGEPTGVIDRPMDGVKALAIFAIATVIVLLALAAFIGA